MRSCVPVRLTEVVSRFHFGVYANGRLLYCGSLAEGFSLTEFMCHLFAWYPEGAWITDYEIIESEGMYHPADVGVAVVFPERLEDLLKEREED